MSSASRCECEGHKAGQAGAKCKAKQSREGAMAEARAVRSSKECRVVRQLMFPKHPTAGALLKSAQQTNVTAVANVGSGAGARYPGSTRSDGLGEGPKECGG